MMRACIGNSRRLWGVEATVAMGGQRRHRSKVGDSVSKRLSSSTRMGVAKGCIRLDSAVHQKTVEPCLHKLYRGGQFAGVLLIEGTALVARRDS